MQMQLSLTLDDQALSALRIALVDELHLLHEQLRSGSQMPPQEAQQRELQTLNALQEVNAAAKQWQAQQLVKLTDRTRAAQAQAVLTGLPVLAAQQGVQEGYVTSGQARLFA